MKSIQRKFNKTVKRNPYWSSLACFTDSIYGIGFSRQSIHRWFNILVNKDDYDKTGKKQVMAFLESVGKYSTTTKKQDNFASEEENLDQDDDNLNY